MIRGNGNVRIANLFVFAVFATIAESLSLEASRGTNSQKKGFKMSSSLGREQKYRIRGII